MQPLPKVKQPSMRRLIIAGSLALVLIVQGGYAILAPREPFPAIVMPGFGASADADGVFRATQFYISIDYDDGSIVQPSVEEFMPEFRFSSARPSLDFMFHPDRNSQASDPPDAVERWLEDRAFALGDGAHPESVSFCWQLTEITLRDASTSPAEDCVMTVIQL